MRPSQTCLLYHFAGISIMIAALVGSILFNDVRVIPEGIGVCAFLWILGIEQDIYKKEEQ